jgi:hypothetical protein
MAGGEEFRLAESAHPGQSAPQLGTGNWKLKTGFI